VNNFTNLLQPPPTINDLLKKHDETGSVLDELKAAIAIEINKITAETCSRAIMDIFPRLEQVLQSNPMEIILSICSDTT